MKKTIITLLVAVCCVVSVSAQNAERTKGIQTKKGYNILPVAGDFAIGIDATPLLMYAGGMFVPTMAPSFGDDYTYTNGTNSYKGSIFGKYFLEDNQAIRLRMLINVGSTLNRFKVVDDEETANNPLNPNATTFDTRNVSLSQFGLYAGYEWRRGYGRLQAFYGAEIGVDFTINKTSYEWGNPMTDLNRTPTSVNWETTPDPTVGSPAERNLNVKGGNGFGMQIGAFAGVEYFFARKMSVGGQVSLNLRYANTGQSTITTQTFNNATNVIDEITKRNGTDGGNREWSFKTPASANLFMMFYF